MTAIEGVRQFLARRSSPNKRLFIGELSAGSESFNPKMDHLTCFLPGTLALGHANGLPDWHMSMAEELLYTCYLTYAAHPTFLAPEITHFNMTSEIGISGILLCLRLIKCVLELMVRRLRVIDGVESDWRQAARLAVCALWDAHGWLWHGYEIRGLENIPEGPFLLIYYHGALPIDMYYFTARLLLFKRRHMHTVADRFMFKIPGWKTLLEGLCVIPGTVQTCTSVLRAGNSLAISPGGVYEAQFGDHYYRLNWKSRIGFAKVALEAKVPIVPMFTRNVREAFRTVGWLRGLCLRIYAKTRIPLAPVYGGFPVKLVTHLGTPIPHDDNITPEQLQKKELRSRIYAKTRIPLAPVYGGFPVKLVTHLGTPIPHDDNITPEQLQKKVTKYTTKDHKSPDYSS
ncbi:Transmembrane protein 68 [Papilio machaon]|uniref:Transmembrane protein 68 n=1 Tax=Papilio machaon TaxID=76193 RepID=A0A194QQE1_PAPMA|nr:Transmembrane protein 68 [Papilio machaon]